MSSITTCVNTQQSRLCRGLVLELDLLTSSPGVVADNLTRRHNAPRTVAGQDGAMDPTERVWQLEREK
jgi:hypothetical protein